MKDNRLPDIPIYFVQAIFNRSWFSQLRNFGSSQITAMSSELNMFCSQKYFLFVNFKVTFNNLVIKAKLSGHILLLEKTLVNVTKPIKMLLLLPFKGLMGQKLPWLSSEDLDSG